jgi:hypothetical protein
MMNVHKHPDGFLVRVQRGGVLRQKFIAGHSERSLRKAEQLATAYRSMSKVKPGLNKVARSNTGVVGVSRSKDGGFQVSLGKGRNRSARTLEQAIAMRQAFERGEPEQQRA